MAATRLDITHASAGNRQIMTFSFWSKISSLVNPINSTYYFPVFHMAVGGDYTLVDFTENNELRLLDANGTDVKTSRKFRDINAWYHIVVAIDTTQATASDRVKMYVNGVQETSFAASTYPTQNVNMSWNNNNLNSIGQHSSATDYYYLGLLSHVHFIDGTQYQASDFGLYDANGVWTIKTSPSVTYGTNGFFILKDGNSLTDQSGNGNNLTLATGSLVNTEDNPSNVFCTVDPLTNPSVSFSNGNLTIANGDDVLSTMGVTSGKWYWEAKITAVPSGIHFGIAATTNSSGSGSQIYTETNTNSSYIWLRNSDISNRNGTGISNANVTDNHSSVTTNDIIGTALDLDSATKKVTFYKNGSEVGNVTFDYDTDIPIFPFFRMNSGNASNINFGNGYFGTTAVASAGTNASGNGIFEYDVPAGHTALCTKGLNGE